MDTRIYTVPIGALTNEGFGMVLSMAISRNRTTTTAYLLTSEGEGESNTLHVLTKTGGAVSLNARPHALPSGSVITNIQYNNTLDEPEIWFQQTNVPLAGNSGALKVYSPRSSTVTEITRTTKSDSFSFSFNNQNNLVYTKDTADGARLKLSAYDSTSKSRINAVYASTTSGDSFKFWTPLFSDYPTNPEDSAWMFNDNTEACIWSNAPDTTPQLDEFGLSDVMRENRPVHSMLETRQHYQQILFTSTGGPTDLILLILSSFTSGPDQVIRIPCKNFTLAGAPCINPTNDNIQVINKETGMLLELDIVNMKANPIGAVPLDVRGELKLQCDDEGVTFIFGCNHVGQPALAIIMPA